LIRSYELRGKLGGGIKPDVEVNITVGLEQLHGRLDSLIGAPSGNREGTARSLLGLSPSADQPIPSRRRPIKDLDELSNPGGIGPLTIDVEPLETVPAQPKAESTTLSDDLTGNSWHTETLGTRWR
jgi:hypothetical protein